VFVRNNFKLHFLNSIEQSVFWEAISGSSPQDILTFVELKLHCPILSRMNAVTDCSVLFLF
jgi:hypothetical protein